jgi:hypothetical protein
MRYDDPPLEALNPPAEVGDRKLQVVEPGQDPVEDLHGDRGGEIVCDIVM